MLNVGFLVSSLISSQLSYYLIRNLNRTLPEEQRVDGTVFVQNLAKPPLTPHFAVLNISEAFDYRGARIATTLDTAARLIRMPGLPAKFFYVWDLEWMRQSGEYNRRHAIYCNPSLHLIARCREHADIIEDCWNRPVATICEDFDMGVLLNAARLETAPNPHRNLLPTGIY